MMPRLFVILLVGLLSSQAAAQTPPHAALDTRLSLLLAERDRLFRDMRTTPKPTEGNRAVIVRQERYDDLAELVLGMLREATARRHGDFPAWLSAARRVAATEIRMLEREHDRLAPLIEGGYATDEAMAAVNLRLAHARSTAQKLARWVSTPPNPPNPPPYDPPTLSLAEGVIDAIGHGDWIGEVIERIPQLRHSGKQGWLDEITGKAMAAARNGDSARAVDLFEQVAMFVPDSPPLLWNLAVLSDRMKVRPLVAAAWYEAFAAASDDAATARARAAELRQGVAVQAERMARKAAALLTVIPEIDRSGDPDRQTDAWVVYGLVMAGAQEHGLTLSRATTGERLPLTISFLAEAQGQRGRLDEVLAASRGAASADDAARWRNGLAHGLTYLDPTHDSGDLAAKLEAVAEEARRMSDNTLAAGVAAAHAQLAANHPAAAAAAERIVSGLPETARPNSAVLAKLVSALAASGDLAGATRIEAMIRPGLYDSVHASCAIARFNPGAKTAECRRRARESLDQDLNAAKPGETDKQLHPRDAMVAAWVLAEHAGDGDPGPAIAELRNRWFKLQAERHIALAAGNHRLAAVLGWTALASALPVSDISRGSGVVKPLLLDLPRQINETAADKPTLVVRRLAIWSAELAATLTLHHEALGTGK